MKFGQLIEYNLGNIFVEKSCIKCAAGTILDPYLKYQNLAYLWINSVKLVSIVCYFEGYRNIVKPSCRPFAFT